ncbi:hypothetical protein ES703_64085 [subsurface metagenome]
MANLMQFASQVAESNPEGYNRQLVIQREAGEPIIQSDKVILEKAVQLRIEQELAEAQKRAEAEAEAEKVPPEPAKEPALATA